MKLQRSLDYSGLSVPFILQFSRMSDGHLVALWSAAFSVFHVKRLAGSKQQPQLRSRQSNGLARATSLMVMLINDSASRYVEKTSCGLRRLRDAFGFQQLDSTRNHARSDPPERTNGIEKLSMHPLTGYPAYN